MIFRYTYGRYVPLERAIRAMLCIGDLIWHIPAIQFWLVNIFFTAVSTLLVSELCLAEKLREEDRAIKKTMKRLGILRPAGYYIGDMKLVDLYEYDPKTGLVGPKKSECGGFRLFFRTPIYYSQTNTMYDDRMRSIDVRAYDRAIKAVWGDKPMWWSERVRDPEKVDQFINAYINKRKVRLYAIYEYENRATGFPCFRFDYEDVK